MYRPSDCNHEDFPCCGCGITAAELEEQEREEYEAWRESVVEDIQYEEVTSEESDQFDDDYDSFIDREDC